MNNKCKSAFVKIEEALNGGYFLVGNELTLVDICIVTTLFTSNQIYYKILQEYIAMHTSSEIFVKGKRVVNDLVSPLLAILIKMYSSSIQCIQSLNKPLVFLFFISYNALII